MPPPTADKTSPQEVNAYLAHPPFRSKDEILWTMDLKEGVDNSKMDGLNKGLIDSKKDYGKVKPRIKKKRKK